MRKFIKGFFSVNCDLGFTLVEVLVATGVFLLFALGIYSVTQVTFQTAAGSRTTILETAIVGEQIEIVRNLPYANVGVLDGIPVGVIPKTQEVHRSGATFIVTTTVRNVDDPSDGTLGGVPNDTAPADYKLVEFTVRCKTCRQLTAPITLSTIVAPKKLEGASVNGALFVTVFNAAGEPVPGATVQIANTAVTPPLTITDVTDVNGVFELVDTPSSSLGYNITVTKAGYSSDYTVSSTPDDSYSVKLPATVISQTVTPLSFAIDRLAALSLKTVDYSCAALGSKTVNISGDKLIATDPDISKFDETVTTDGAGTWLFSSLEWDTYNLSTSGTSFDVAGATPQLPLKLNPGEMQEARLVLVPHTSNSLLVAVRDAGTGLPLSDATVQIVTSNGNTTLSNVTGLGYVRQTDWSGGSGQAAFTNASKYFSDDGNLTLGSPAGDITLKKTGGNYAASGRLESSTIDLGQGVDFKKVQFQPLDQPSQTGVTPVRLQIAASDISAPASWDFVGPDGTAVTYFTPTSTLISGIQDNKRFFRYRLYLSTADTKRTPQVSELSFTYTASCTPPGQAWFDSLSKDMYTMTVSRFGYDTVVGDIDVSGYSDTIVDLSVSN